MLEWSSPYVSLSVSIPARASEINLSSVGWVRSGASVKSVNRAKNRWGSRLPR